MRWLIAFSVSVLFVVCSSLAALAAPAVTVTPVDNEITSSEKATFDVTITNTDERRQTYSLYALEILWDVDPEIRQFSLFSGDSRILRVEVQPLGPLEPSLYAVKLYVDGKDAVTSAISGREIASLPVVLYPVTPRDYLPALAVTVDMDEHIDPQDPLSIKLFIENKNPLNLPGTTVQIQSDMPEFVQQTTIDIPPFGTRTIEFTVTPNAFQQPKQYVLFFVFERDGQTIKVVDQPVEILPLVPDFSLEREQETVFLKQFNSLTVANEGNVLNTQQVAVPISFIGALLTDDTRAITKDGQRHLVWNITLAPNERTTIRFVTNYRLLLYLAALALAFVAFYFSVKSPLQLQKTAATIRGGEEGTLSEVKITLEVRNRSGRHIKEVLITDTVPGIANVEKSLELGTVKPRDIHQTKKGTKVVWSLVELEPLEHRLITYKIKAKLNILGAFNLPRATVEYGKRSGKRGKAYSNTFRLG